MMIGYELYCKLIDNAVRKLRGEAVTEEELEVALEIKVNAYISSDYIEDEKLKLDMYKRIAEIRTEGDISDVTRRADRPFRRRAGGDRGSDESGSDQGEV